MNIVIIMLPVVGFILHWLHDIVDISSIYDHTIANRLAVNRSAWVSVFSDYAARKDPPVLYCYAAFVLSPCRTRGSGTAKNTSARRFRGRFSRYRDYGSSCLREGDGTGGRHILPRRTGSTDSQRWRHCKFKDHLIHVTHVSRRVQVPTKWWSREQHKRNSYSQWVHTKSTVRVVLV